MSRRSRSLFGLRRLARIALTLLVLSGVAAGSIGFPVSPIGTLGGDFPCQGHGCGCRSASDCWFGCCCLTPAQRLAWAEKRGITPPAPLVELARQDAETTREKPSCCTGHGKACCSKAGKTPKTPKTCCTGPTIREGRSKADSESSAPCFVPTRCRGFGQSWVTIGQPFGLPEKPAAIAESTVCESIAFSGVDYRFFLAPPPTRPG